MELMRSHSPQRRAEARVDLAVQVAESLGQYGWVTLPQRPLTVEAPDEDLIRFNGEPAGQQLLALQEVCDRRLLFGRAQLHRIAERPQWRRALRGE